MDNVCDICMYNKDRHKDTNHKLPAIGPQQQQDQLEAVHDLLLSADSSKTTIYDIEVTSAPCLY